jgi:methanogenic corrinoid protein MtbC1
LFEQGLVQRRREGRKIYYSLTDRRVQALLSQPEDSAVALDLSAVFQDYVKALREWNVAEAEHIVASVAEAGASWQRVFLEILLPGLRQVGRWWEQGEISVGHEHTASCLTERLISRLSPNGHHAMEIRPDASGILVGCAPGDYHCIGARITADFLEEAGYRVIYLGGNVPQSEFLCAARRHSPSAAIVSLCIKDLEPGALETIRALTDHETFEALKVIAGGRVPLETPIPFRAAGVDAIAKDPQHAVACVRELLDGSE